MSDLSYGDHAKRKELEKAAKAEKKVAAYWAKEGAEILKKGSAADFKKLFADDDNSVHILSILTNVTKSSWKTGGLTYPEVDLSKLRDAGYGKLVDYILSNLTTGMGIRPDTPFHSNKEGKYAASVDAPYRYMELSALGGGMRLVFDSTASELFITIHYSHPTRLVASKAPDSAPLAALLTSLGQTQVRLVTLVDTATVELGSLKDPLFRAYVLHPINSYLPGMFGFTKGTKE